MADPQSVVLGLNGIAKLAGALKDLIQAPSAREQAAQLIGLVASAKGDTLEMLLKYEACQARVRDLEEQLRRHEDWQQQKLRYELRSPAPGALVYAVKRAMSNDEPAHYICASCYLKGEPAILQCLPVTKSEDYAWVCQCGSKAMTGYRGPSDPQYAEQLT